MRFWSVALDSRFVSPFQVIWVRNMKIWHKELLNNWIYIWNHIWEKQLASYRYAEL